MKLLEPLNLGPFQLKNRMLMAAMTRSRAAADGTPVECMALYYRQRASARLILSEAINISPAAIGRAHRRHAALHQPGPARL